MKRLLMLTVAVSTFMGTSALFAANHTVFVHGRSGESHCGTGTTDVNNYWGSSKNLATPEQTYFVGYDGSSDPRDWGECRAQSNLWSVLYNQCRGADSCKVICHSAGCYAVDYFFSKYDYVVDSYDINVDWVQAVAGAAGGSELADLKFWDSGGMDYALKTSQARSWNHNVTAGISRWHLAGFDGWWYSSWRLPGEDDGAVAFHSGCGKNSTGSYDECKYDGSNWSNHYVWRDSAESSYSSGEQAYDRDHNQMKSTARSIWNRMHGY